MASTAQDERRVRAHWTPERIAALNTPLSDNPPHDAADGTRWKGGGASGGPRFGDFSAATGHGALVGVNTQSGRMDATGAGCDDEGDPACVRHLVGPRFTTALTEPLHEKAQRLR